MRPDESEESETSDAGHGAAREPGEAAAEAREAADPRTAAAARGRPGEAVALRDLFDREVVLDTAGPLVYLGRLVGLDAYFFTLADVDVHDMQDGRTPKEKYILDARKLGIKKNRARVLVRRDVVISISLLADVIDY